MLAMQMLPFYLVNWVVLAGLCIASSSPDTCLNAVDTTLRRPFSASSTTFFDFKPKDKNGLEYDLSRLRGKVVLVFNTASECGFTPQLQALQQLYKDVTTASNQDFELLGVPCNQFGDQEPGTNDDIQSFCRSNYGVSFPVLAKTDVIGDDTEPVYAWMQATDPTRGGPVRWNFEKFLIGRDGQVKGRWFSTTLPNEIRSFIDKELIG